jgi:hypothetical protein
MCQPLGEPTKMQITVNIAIEDRDGTHVATCLEMGLVAVSDDLQDLHSKMEKLIHRQVTFAVQNENFQDIFHPAEPEVWQRLQEAFHSEKAKEVRKTEEDISGYGLKQTAYALAG